MKHHLSGGGCFLLKGIKILPSARSDRSFNIDPGQEIYKHSKPWACGTHIALNRLVSRIKTENQAELIHTIN